jgi:hypothetical protein
MEMNDNNLAPIEGGDSDSISAGRPEGGDWRSHYHSREEHDNVGPPEFLIAGVLQREAILGIGAFIGQKKTLLALNLVWSLCSGEPLFGRFKVTRKPSRVLYLGPENGMNSFSNRVNQIGLREHIGKTFFYSTMAMPGKTPLPELAREEIHGSVIFIDTAIRYIEGDENSSTAMKAFSEMAFSLIRDGAEAVIMMHHSSKTGSKSNELTLENCFRGTGELTAFLSTAIGVRTQDMSDEYKSPSLIRFVKQRDFEAEPASFEVLTSKETCRMTFVNDSGGATITKKAGGVKTDADGKQAAADAIIRANWKLSGSKLAALLKSAGISRKDKWVTQAKKRLRLEDLDAQGPHGVTAVKARKR